MAPGSRFLMWRPKAWREWNKMKVAVRGGKKMFLLLPSNAWRQSGRQVASVAARRNFEGMRSGQSNVLFVATAEGGAH